MMRRQRPVDVECAGCDRPIHAIPETTYSTGWVHRSTNSELCDRTNYPHPTNLARPAAIANLDD